MSDKIRYWLKEGQKPWESVGRSEFIETSEECGVGPLNSEKDLLSFSSNLRENKELTEGQITHTNKIERNEGRDYSPEFIAAFQKEIAKEQSELQTA